ncbi:MAG: HPr family phosphocarrier protein [Nocardioides sp.]|uniref:HPr family phosphocarrier protein n=1 Tax=Nocardioides sp. TaxID=35761 RepID=UPI0039E29603
MSANSEIVNPGAVSFNAEVTLPGDVDLHARPAAEVVRAAAGFASTVEVRVDDRVADATSMLALLTLGIRRGTTVTLHAEGEDAARAVQAVVDAISNLQD